MQSSRATLCNLTFDRWRRWGGDKQKVAKGRREAAFLFVRSRHRPQWSQSTVPPQCARSRAEEVRSVGDWAIMLDIAERYEPVDFLGMSVSISRVQGRRQM